MSKPMSMNSDPGSSVAEFFLFFVTGIVMLITKLLAIFANIYTWHIPPIVMEGGQLLAWAGITLTGLIALLNYFKIQIPNPFKKKKKNG